MIRSLRAACVALALAACRRGASSTSSVASTSVVASTSASSSIAPFRPVVVDGHADTPTEWLEHPFDVCKPSAHQVDFPKMRAGGLDVELFAAYVPAKHADHDAYAFTTTLIDDIHRMVDACPSDAAIALSTDDIRAIVASGRRAIVVSIEGGHAIEDSLEKLDDFYRRGVRAMTLTHFNTNHWADSANDAPKHHGLTPKGESVIREMNRLGMMIDVSHASDETFWDVLGVTKAPIVATHSSVRALCDKPRNVSDDMLRAVAKNHGVVMINFLSMYLAADAKTATASTIVDHVEHAIEVAGVDSVGLGSDFGNDVPLAKGMEDATKLPFVADELRRRGHSEEDIHKVMGENFMRVFAEVERVARDEAASK